MSKELINHNEDLRKLYDEGYAISIVDAHLIIDNIPYVASDKSIKYGKIISTLQLEKNDKTGIPSNHIVLFCGEHPCDKNGKEIESFRHNEGKQTIAHNIIVDRSFSTKPEGGYKDYYHKMTTYINLIIVEAQMINNKITAKGRAVILDEDLTSPFLYINNSPALSGIAGITHVFKEQKIGIIGLGGTGSYLLDLVVKTEVSEIHLFDEDILLQENVFRSPGAASVSILKEAPRKVDYYAEAYGQFRKGIIAHAENVTEFNLIKLETLDFVFICIDKSSPKRLIVDYLVKKEKSFIDVGIGISKNKDNKLMGIISTTISTPENREVFEKTVDFSNVEGDNAYETNIQIAELNCMNACFAVMRWKKLNGIYAQGNNELRSNFTIIENRITND